MKTKVITLVLLSILMFPIMAKSQVKIKQTAGRDALGEFAPEFARLNDDVLFGEVWSRNDLLSLRDRSIVTVVALMSQGLTDSSFKYHLESAKKKRSDQNRNGRNPDPCRILCRLAESVGGISHGKGSLDGHNRQFRCYLA